MRRGASPIATSHMTCDIATFTVTSLPRTDHSPDSRLCASICWLLPLTLEAPRREGLPSNHLLKQPAPVPQQRQQQTPITTSALDDETAGATSTRGADGRRKLRRFRLGIALAAAIGLEGRRAFERRRSCRHARPAVPVTTADSAALQPVATLRLGPAEAGASRRRGLAPSTLPRSAIVRAAAGAARGPASASPSSRWKRCSCL